MEFENNRTDEILEESQEGGQERGIISDKILSTIDIITNNSKLIKNNANNPPSSLTMDEVFNIIIRLRNIITNRTSNGVTTASITMTDGLTPGTITNRPIFYSDLLQLNNASSEISRIFNAIPIAQFKHLPDPSVLNTPPSNGGQYILSENEFNEQQSIEQTPVEQTPEVIPETAPTTETTEELPSLEVEEPITSGGSRRHKWSSHKKRRHTRIRTKKNKKL